MNPEEKHLLERAVKLSEENNHMLRKLHRTARWAFVWGVIKLVILVVPFIIGYFYLEPYFGSLGDTFEKARETINQLK